MSATDAQIAKLPKWARDEIAHLARQLADANAKIAALTTGEPSLVSWSDGLKADHPLPEYATVRFKIHDGYDGDLTAHITKRHQQTVLAINGGRAIHVYPGASNAIYITPEGWDES